MRTFRRVLLGTVLALSVSGCVSHTYAPGPGMSAADFGPDSAKCRLFARGSQGDFAFGAYGSPQYVGSAMAGAALGYAIGSAVDQSRNYDDCMQARGWEVADHQPEITIQPEPTPSTNLDPPWITRSDWVKGLEWGTQSPQAVCKAPADIQNTTDWMNGCRSGQHQPRTASN